MNTNKTKMKKTDYKPLIPICSDEELKDIAEQWCDLVGTEPTNTTLNAFMMGAKIAISNIGWVVNQNEDDDIKIECLIGETYQVTDGSTVWFQGRLSDCKAYLN